MNTGVSNSKVLYQLNFRFCSVPIRKPVLQQSKKFLSSNSSSSFSCLFAASSSYFCFWNSNSFFLCSDSSSLKLAFLTFFVSSISMADSFDALFFFLTGFAFDAGKRKSCLIELNNKNYYGAISISKDRPLEHKILKCSPLFGHNQVILLFLVLETTTFEEQHWCYILELHS